MGKSYRIGKLEMEVIWSYGAMMEDPPHGVTNAPSK